MRRIYACIMAAMVMIPVSAGAQLIGNPGTNVGEKNLFVGLEYSSITSTYDFDTSDLATSQERVALKITVGLSERFDIYIRGGGASLTMDYEGNNYRYNNLGYASRNLTTDYNPGFGGGARFRLFNFVDSGTQVFIDGGGFMFSADDEIRWNMNDGSTFIKDRDMRWVDLYASVGVSRRIDYVDLTFGVGFSDIWWEIDDVDITRSGTTESRLPRDTRSSFEFNNPVFGFVGIDFVLPLEYRLSAQAAIRSLDDAQFSVAISQGLQKD